MLREMLKVAYHEQQLNSLFDKHPPSDGISLIMCTYANAAIQRGLARYTHVHSNVKSNIICHCFSLYPQDYRGLIPFNGSGR